MQFISRHGIIIGGGGGSSEIGYFVMLMGSDRQRLSVISDAFATSKGDVYQMGVVIP